MFEKPDLPMDPSVLRTAELDIETLDDNEARKQAPRIELYCPRNPMLVFA